MKFLSALRPRAASAAELRAKLDAAEHQAATLAAAVADMERQRGPMLLDAPPAAAKKAEEALAVARDELAAVRAVRDTLAERTVAAETAEALASLRADIADAAAEAAELVAWFRDRMPDAVSELVGIAEREAALCDRIRGLMFRQREIAETIPEASAIALPVEPFTRAGHMGRFAEIIRVPAIRGGKAGA